MTQNINIRKLSVRLGGMLPVLFAVSIAFADDNAKTPLGIGRVTADDVYIRSGPSANHYTICKLKSDDRVTIVGESGEWYEILPPDGTFSLISADYVDTIDDKSGVVNGNNVRVRAGSSLTKDKYTVQTKLSKGAEVRILGRNPDGFLRIVPPPGTSLWVSRQYVRRALGDTAESDSGVDRTNENPITEDETGEPVSQAGAASKADTAPKPVSPLEELPPTEERRELIGLDAGVRAELENPVLERNLAPLLAKYREIATQKEDELARRYAEKRAEQVEDIVALGDAVRKVRVIGEEAQIKRREFMDRRAQVPQALPPSPAALDARGILRVSALYPPGSRPQRYRLLGSDEPAARTIGYVEIPLNSSLDVSGFLGRLVGVRASEKRLQPGGVDPVLIYVASELVLIPEGALPAPVQNSD